jgi:RHS repeat-associated protein
LVEEDALYPFGYPRNQYQPRSLYENYKFTHKEQDHESGMQYFETRFYNPSLEKFARSDTRQSGGVEIFRDTPQRWNCYAYCVNSPVVRTDPDGTFDWKEVGGGVIKTATGVIDTFGGAVALGLGVSASMTAVLSGPGAVTAALGGATLIKGLATLGTGTAELTSGLMPNSWNPISSKEFDSFEDRLSLGFDPGAMGGNVAADFARLAGTRDNTADAVKQSVQVGWGLGNIYSSYGSMMNAKTTADAASAVVDHFNAVAGTGYGIVKALSGPPSGTQSQTAPNSAASTPQTPSQVSGNQSIGNLYVDPKSFQQ